MMHLRILAITLIALIACDSSQASKSQRRPGSAPDAAPSAVDDAHPLLFDDWHETSKTSDYHKGACAIAPVPQPPPNSLTCTGAPASMTCEGGWTVTTAGEVATATTSYGAGCTYQVLGHAGVPGKTLHGRKRIEKARKALRAARPDPRTPQQIAQAACAGGGCKGSQVKPLLAATGAQPLIPPAWTVPNWYRDKANVTGCAADTNSGTAATCSGGCSGSTCPSGVGPVVNYQEIATHRWGTYCPRLQQATTITAVSSDSDASDPWYECPYLENSGYLVNQGVLGTAQQVCATTLSGVAAKNRSTPQILNVNFTSCAGAAANLLIVNLTHASRATIYKAAGDEGWDISQPQTGYTPPFLGEPTEVDTWAIGDSVVVYNPVQVNLVSQEQTQTSYSGSFDNLVYDYQLQVYDPGGVGNDDFFDGARVQLMDVYVQRYMVWVAAAGDLDSLQWLNVSEIGAESEADVQTLDVYGGIVGSSLTGFETIAGYLGNDTILAQATDVRNGDVARACIDAGAKLTTINLGGFVSESGSGPFVWGDGAYDSFGTALMLSGTFTPAFLFKGTLSINNQTTACSYTVATPSVINCGITLTPTALDASASSTGFGGKAFLPGAGSITNYGP